LEEILKHALEPMYVLNERGEVVFTNPAFERAFGYSTMTPAEKARLRATLLACPVDLPAGSARSATRPWGDTNKRTWWTLTFLSLQWGERDPLAVIGHITPGRSSDDGSIGVPTSADALVIEQLARLAERQAFPPLDQVLVACSPGMKRVIEQVRLAAQGEVPVTIVGEEGVGKRLLAQQVRLRSPRSASGAATIDCEALPPDVQREQFFDIARVSVESLTAEETSHFPLLDDPRGGTLIIHNASKLAIDVQERLVGMTEEASNPLWRLILTERESLEQIRAEGCWSAPFFELVRRLVIPVPPLRERWADLELLVGQMLARPDAVNAAGLRVSSIDPAALARLRQHDFPGNVTELHQILRRALRKTTKPTLSERDLPRYVGHADRHDVPAHARVPLPSLNEVLESVERRLIGLALRRHQGNKSKAAKELGISRPRLHRRAQELGFSIESTDEPPSLDMDEPSSGEIPS
jgi:DNA-binding NtrC family response regulator